MPRFFFDFRQGCERIADTRGIEFADVEEAYLESFRAAQDMWSELLKQRRDPRRCSFEVRSQQDEPLFVLPFQEVLDSCIDRKLTPMQHTLRK